MILWDKYGDEHQGDCLYCHRVTVVRTVKLHQGRKLVACQRCINGQERKIRQEMAK